MMPPLVPTACDEPPPVLAVTVATEGRILITRWIGIAVAAVATPFRFGPGERPAIWGICAAAALYTLLFDRLIIRTRPAWLRHGVLTTLGDAALAGAVIAVTGGLRSDFWVVYFLIAAVTAVRFGGRAAAGAMAAVLATYVAVLAVTGTPPTGATLAVVFFRLGFVACAAFFLAFVGDRTRGAERRLVASYHATLAALSAALDQRDGETEQHSRRVTAFALRLGREAGLGEPALTSLEQGALLHDIGKIGVPDHILRKPGPLAPEEWATMSRHPLMGARILAGIPFLADALPVVVQHHERWDGSGYPGGRRGQAIDIRARIFAIVDAYDAMTSDRPYRPAVPHEAALAELTRAGGRQFDPDLVRAFARVPAAEWRAIAALDRPSPRPSAGDQGVEAAG